jgi:hypothetical protein
MKREKALKKFAKIDGVLFLEWRRTAHMTSINATTQSMLAACNEIQGTYFCFRHSFNNF